MSRDRERFDPVAAAVFSCIDHCLLCLGRLVRPRSSRLSPVVTARSGRSLAPLWKRSRRRFSGTLSIVDAFRSAVYRHVVSVLLSSVGKAILSTL